MGELKRKTPETMPSKTAVNKANTTLQKKMIVAGSRGSSTKKNREPSFETHSVYDVIDAGLERTTSKHVLIFVHGYNVSRKDALVSGSLFFKQLQNSFARDGQSIEGYEYILFTWPGDVGPVWFNDAQKYAQHSGVALYEMVCDLNEKHGVDKITLITHSLGAHVGLRSASVLAERLIRKKKKCRFRNVLLLAPAVENDVFHRPHLADDYHFPESPFAMEQLNIFASRGDDVLKKAYSVSERDAALGYAGPQSMSPLKTMSQRVPEVLGPEYSFQFELHDFSPNSTLIMNPALHAHNHSDYWKRHQQTDFYINMIK